MTIQKWRYAQNPTLPKYLFFMINPCTSSAKVTLAAKHISPWRAGVAITVHPAEAAHFENVWLGLEIPSEKSAKERGWVRVHLQFGRVGEAGRLGRREHFLPREKTSKVQTRVDDEGIYLCKSNQRGPTNKNGGALLQEIIKTCCIKSPSVLPTHACACLQCKGQTGKNWKENSKKKTMSWLRLTGCYLSAADYDGGKTRRGHFSSLHLCCLSDMT